MLLPGVTVGESNAIGAGSVVTRDLLANVAAAGNPDRGLRPIGDRRYSYKELEIDRE